MQQPKFIEDLMEDLAYCEKCESEQLANGEAYIGKILLSKNDAKLILSNYNSMYAQLQKILDHSGLLSYIDTHVEGMREEIETILAAARGEVTQPIEAQNPTE